MLVCRSVRVPYVQNWKWCDLDGFKGTIGILSRRIHKIVRLILSDSDEETADSSCCEIISPLLNGLSHKILGRYKDNVRVSAYHAPPNLGNSLCLPRLRSLLFLPFISRILVDLTSFLTFFTFYSI